MPTLVPYLVVRDAKRAIAFYQQAFGAVEEFRLPAPDGRIMHARLHIGDSQLMLSDDFPEHCGFSRTPERFGGSPVIVHLNSDDVDKTVAKAVAAGATATMPVSDMFWGDRYGTLRDPFGHEWSVSTPGKKQLTAEEIRAAADAAMSAAKQQRQQQQQ